MSLKHLFDTGYEPSSISAWKELERPNAEKNDAK